MSFHRVTLVCLLLGASALARGQSNLPLGLPADQILPLSLDGYKLVSLDRTKELVFDLGDKRVTVEVPLFVYLPEADLVAGKLAGLKAIQAELGRLASQRDPVDPQRLMTLFLALDRITSQSETVKLAPAPAGKNSTPPVTTVKAAATTEAKPAPPADNPPEDNPLAKAIKH
ncbi:MAG: hypothetical protein PHE83_14965 [Opitutaceae bacterium]|nr:hypothetical protein [Opitutaceae bacterium]